MERTVAEDSLDILPSLRESQTVRTEIVYQMGIGILGLRQENWVYLRKGGRKEPAWYQEWLRVEPVDAPALLFDLNADEGQRRNLYHQHPDRIQFMEARLQEIERSSSTAPRGSE